VGAGLAEDQRKLPSGESLKGILKEKGSIGLSGRDLGKGFSRPRE